MTLFTVIGKCYVIFKTYSFRLRLSLEQKFVAIFLEGRGGLNLSHLDHNSRV